MADLGDCILKGSIKLTMPGGDQVILNRVHGMKSWIWNQLTDEQKASIEYCDNCDTVWFISAYCYECGTCPECVEKRGDDIGNGPSLVCYACDR